jgi:hypothetical protein
MHEIAGGIDLADLFAATEEALHIRHAPRPDDLHWTGLRRLADALTQAAQGEAPGLRAARREIRGWIQSYIAFEQDCARYPEIAQVPVERPLFLVAFGRTGSTLLHNLLALPPWARAPRLWELWSPSPPPKSDAEDRGARLDTARHRLDFLAKFAPVVALSHPMDPEAPDECHWIMRHSPLWAMLYDVPGYWEWLKSLKHDELRRLYLQYRLQVQHLQLFRRGIWISKAFSHLHFLPVLHDVFPDARIVRLHRDPCAAVASLCSLAQSRRSIYSTRVDPSAVGVSILDLFLDGMARAIAVDRARPDAPVIDIHFDDLVADPIGTVRRVHETLGYPYDAAFERAMRDYLARISAAPAYQHRYSLEQFGLSRAQILDRSAEYLAWAAARCGKPLT